MPGPISSRSRWHAKTGAVRFIYASGESLLMEPTEGNFSIGSMNAENEEHIKVTNRTRHDGFVEGPDLVQDVSIDLQMPRETLTDGAAPRLLDFLRHTGSFAAATSVDSTILAWHVDLDVTDGVISGKIRRPLVEGEFSIAEGAEFNTISFSGRNHTPPEFT